MTAHALLADALSPEAFEAAIAVCQAEMYDTVGLSVSADAVLDLQQIMTVRGWILDGTIVIPREEKETP